MIENNEGLYVLHTKNTTYMFNVMEAGHLEHLYYGRRIKVDLDKENGGAWPFIEKHAFPPGNTNQYDREHATFTLEDMCLEMSSYGKGDIREPFIEVTHEDGSFTSDFLLKDADEWRPECWQMIRQRSDLWFFFFTKRIDRFMECIPDDWGDGYDNVIVGCTVENQAMADYRLPIFRSLPIKHKSIIVAPMLTAINLEQYLDKTIDEVAVGGESGLDARPCHYDWILALREQCVAKDVAFRFHQTGARFVKDGKMFRVPRRFQLSQAHKANIDCKIGEYLVPETVKFEWKDSDYHD